MGLTNASVGLGAVDEPLLIRRRSPQDLTVALAGNPNVGKSTVFNALTGMHQHTGNWPGKTVANAQGYCRSAANGYVLVDIPGTYSLYAHSSEEEIARDFICFGEPDLVVAVCDATCLSRNLHLVLQILETGARVVVCVNLLDEARRLHLYPDLALLQSRLKVPVVGVVARKKQSLRALLEALDRQADAQKGTGLAIPYPFLIESAIAQVEAVLDPKALGGLDSRWLAARLLDSDPDFRKSLTSYLGTDVLGNEDLQKAVREARIFLADNGIDGVALQDLMITSTVEYASFLLKDVVKSDPATQKARHSCRIDRFLTGRITGFGVMLLLLMAIFWLTVQGANYPSAWLSAFFFQGLDALSSLLSSLNTPPWLIGFLVDGVLRVAAWVVSVMLPPMAIFFPLFTILEDVGYLPRVAYNLDRPFAHCNACGKQALTMCMGLGCNAAGVVGCRIIDSKRERLLAILTNSLIPCNGRFPSLVAIITIFLVGFGVGVWSPVLSALLLTVTILFCVLATLAMTKLLSHTLLCGMPSSFTLEIPPFRRPQVGQILLRSVFDRVLFVLGRSVAVALPAGAVIWILANVSVGGGSLLGQCAAFLDPFAGLFGMDGVILLAFLLGFPANEIVIPIIIMAYQSGSVLTDYESLDELGALLCANGWTTVTAICVLVFFLFHWPCSTTLLTIKKETGSLKWTLLAALLPTLLGLLLCFLIATAARLLGL